MTYGDPGSSGSAHGSRKRIAVALVMVVVLALIVIRTVDLASHGPNLTTMVSVISIPLIVIACVNWLRRMK